MDRKKIREAHKILGQMVEKWGSFFIISQVVVVIGFPILEVVLALPEVKTPWYIWVVVVFLHIIIGGLSILGSVDFVNLLKIAKIDSLEQDFIRLENENKALSEKFAHLVDEMKEHIRRQIALQTSLRILNDLRKQAFPFNEDNLKKIMAPMVRDRATALGFGNREYYNFAVYLLDEKDKKLKIFYRECDDRIQRNDREWEIGVGHVGVAFARGESILNPDTSKDLQYNGRFSLETDTHFYASFISSPIFKGDNKETEKIGVLVVTSSKPNHFEEDDIIIVESYSFLLSLYFSSCNYMEGNNDETS